jgi:hypothetical protein
MNILNHYAIRGGENHQMNIFKWIKSTLSAPIATSESKSNGRNFATDYAAASKLLRDQLDTKFPDNYHASFESRLDRMRDHGAERKDAIDAISKEISLALRQGTTVRDAAARGAKAVGL